MRSNQVSLLAALASLALAGPALAGNARGVDVSEYQGRIDWARVAASGVSFGIARVSDGVNHPDSTFARNWAGMKANGVVRGVYQFFRPSQDPVAQADLLVSTVGQFGPYDLPPVLDVEVTSGQSSSVIAAKISAWVSRIKARTGLTPMIYTGPGFWNGLARRPSVSGVPLWVAHWGVAAPRLPAGWSEWAFWQHTSHASVPGITGGVDGDVFHGSVTELKAFAASHGVGGVVRGGAPAPVARAHPVLRSGATGAEVLALQDALARHGFSPGPRDGVFGARTLAAVKSFQRASQLVPDGVVGPLTWSALSR